MVSNKSHRSNAEDARAAAAATKLPNVRDRHLRSAEAHEAAATREERAAANYAERLDEAAARKAEAAQRAEDTTDEET